MKILITNAVPLNGGDEALLRATVDSLKARWPHAHVTTLCKHAKKVQSLLPDLSIDSDLEFVSDGDRRRVYNLYQEADIVISAPGGFLHDFYPIHDRLEGFKVALRLGKPLILLAQSIGPFWKPGSQQSVREVLNHASVICVRDAASKQHLIEAGVDKRKVRVTADAAFLWWRLAPELFQSRNRPIRTIALSFRIWPWGDDVEVNRTVEKAVSLCDRLLADSKRDLVFLSTCQGVDGYVDDSLLALRILDGLDPALRTRCRVDRTRYHPLDLIRAYSRCDAFIGMRLHGCILSMLGGTPAFGLGYEQKTEEIFRQMGLGAYQLRFETSSSDWIDNVETFLQDLPVIHLQLKQTLDRLAARAARNVHYAARVLDRQATVTEGMNEARVE